MTMASMHGGTLKLQSLRLSQPRCLFADRFTSHLVLVRPPLSSSVLTFARRRTNNARLSLGKNKVSFFLSFFLNKLLVLPISVDLDWL